jgi:hypothetical protein
MKKILLFIIFLGTGAFITKEAFSLRWYSPDVVLASLSPKAPSTPTPKKAKPIIKKLPPSPNSISTQAPAPIKQPISNHSDLQKIGEQKFDGPLSDWDVIWNDKGLGSIVSGIWQVKYEKGFSGGSAPATIIHALPVPKEVFVSFDWKANADWQGHGSNVNKLEFIYFEGNGGDINLQMYGTPGGPYELRTCLQFKNADTRCWLRPNVNKIPVTLGDWHKIEWLVQSNSSAGVADGVVKWWMDGVLIGNYTDVLFPQEKMEEYKLSPTWGGVGEEKNKDDYFWFDNLYLSTK